MGSYSTYKFDILVNRKGNELTKTELEDFHPENHSFGNSDGLNFAFGITPGKFLTEIDETISELNVTKTKYGVLQSGEYFIEVTYPSFHKCS